MASKPPKAKPLGLSSNFKGKVVYKPISAGYYHKYIIYTDASGNKFAIRGGPENKIDGEYDSLVLDYGKYNENFPDFDSTDGINLKQLFRAMIFPISGTELRKKCSRWTGSLTMTRLNITQTPLWIYPFVMQG